MQPYSPTFAAGDLLLSSEKTLPTTGTVFSDPIQIAEAPLTSDGRHTQSDELWVSIPKLTAAELPAAASLTVSIQFSDKADFTDATDIREISDSTAKITGSTSGSPGLGISFQIPFQCGMYCRMKITAGGTAGATTKTARLDYLVP
ncbi:MAG: hypothetical protein ACRC2T_12360 [Thermoguttaceae bacterium]